MRKISCTFFILLISIAVNAQDAIPGQTIYSSNFNIDNIPRSCTFYIPLGYGKQETYPLVIMLHDKGSSAKSIIKTYGDLFFCCICFANNFYKEIRVNIVTTPEYNQRINMQKGP